MKLARRWMVHYRRVVIAVVALRGVSQLGAVRLASSEECRPVKDLLEFNQSQAEQIASKTGDSKGIPNVAEEGAYQAGPTVSPSVPRTCTNPSWPETPRSSPASPESSSESSLSCAHSAVACARCARTSRGYEMEALNSQITETLAKLSDACPT